MLLVGRTTTVADRDIFEVLNDGAANVVPKIAAADGIEFVDRQLTGFIIMSELGHVSLLI
jgi:hypothetical protein